MSGKGSGKRKKGAGSSRTQQQQQAAAKRNIPVSRAGTPAETGRDRAVQTSNAAPTHTRPGQVRYYLDVSAVRIQDWLGRTPDLKFRRGASVLLSEATAPQAWKGRLPAGVRWNDEAGAVEGVVSLVADGPSADDTTSLIEAARAVVRSMRETMPHCPVQAVAGTGDSYATAYPAMALARRDGDFLIDSPPAPPEVILAKPCDQCRAAAAVKPGVKVSSDDTVDLCEECAARLDAAGRTAGRPSQAPLPEQRLRKALEEAEMPVQGFSDTFADMAGAGQRDRDDAATQIALIYADGNRVGAFLSRAAGIPHGPDKATIAPLLHQATLGALAHAVIDRFRGWPRPPVLVNLAGGDDLLVSVPAVDAWLFTRTLLTAFTSLIADKTGAWPTEARENIPTLAAGLVFHHLTTPFSDVVRLAGDQLVLAKSKTRGSAAVAFLDMTADGSQPPPGRAPVMLAYLEEHDKRLQQIADLPASRRQTLLDLDGQGKTGDFIRRLTDFDNRPLWEIAAGSRADAPTVRDVLGRDENKRHEVRRALDIARHWHAEPRGYESETP